MFFLKKKKRKSEIKQKENQSFLSPSYRFLSPHPRQTPLPQPPLTQLFRPPLGTATAPRRSPAAGRVFSSSVQPRATSSSPETATGSHEISPFPSPSELVRRHPGPPTAPFCFVELPASSPCTHGRLNSSGERP